MKKYLAIMMCAGLLLTATGCSEEEREDDSSKKENTKVEEKEKEEEKVKNKVLSCSEYFSDETFMDATFVYDVDGKIISEASLKYQIKVPKEQLEEIASKNEDELCEDFGDSESIKKCTAKLEGNKLVANLRYDVDKLDEDEDGFTKETPIDELKELMEGDEDDEDGATCKIEEK